MNKKPALSYTQRAN